MSDISPIARTAAASFEPLAKIGRSNSAPAVDRGNDQVELSDSARFLAKVRENPIREDLVNTVRAQIEAGTYESDDKLDAAIDELVSDL